MPKQQQCCQMEDIAGEDLWDGIRALPFCHGFNIIVIMFPIGGCERSRDYSFEKSLQHEMSCGSMSLDVIR